MKNRKVYVTTFCGVAVAMNIVLGIITSALGIPLYLDTLGTVLSAAILGSGTGNHCRSIEQYYYGADLQCVRYPILSGKYGSRSDRRSCGKKMEIWNRTSSDYRYCA